MIERVQELWYKLVIIVYSIRTMGMNIEESSDLTFRQQIRSMPGNYWYACLMELFERLAYVGVRAILPLYLVRSTADNGLGLNFSQKGIIFSLWALIQCFVPLFSGAYTDRYGYRKSLIIAFCLTISGYLAMAFSRSIASSLTLQGLDNPEFWVFLCAACLVGLGTAIFKPAVQGTIAKSTTEANSSVAWGTFYWIVNIGAWLAPICAALLRCEIDWDHVFFAAAIVTTINVLPVLFLFKEPNQSLPKDSDSLQQSIPGVLFPALRTIFTDLRLMLFLAIFSCFWLMFMQLWDLLPNFIDEWVDTSDVSPFFGWLNHGWIMENGQTKPEMIISINALAVILFVLPISWLIRRSPKVVAMIIGMLISTIGFAGSGASNLGWLCCMMVFVFSIGEMTCSPTFSAYVGLIAPAKKKALYMGYSNIPFAVGWASGSVIGGILYEKLGSKINLARRYMVEHLGMDPGRVMSDEQLPSGQVMETLASAIDGDTAAATTLLWDTYHPYILWYGLGAFGLLAVISMTLFYYRCTKQR